jgi:uncharacterized membrane protein HdeD (DUF308 family)
MAQVREIWEGRAMATTPSSQRSTWVTTIVIVNLLMAIILDGVLGISLIALAVLGFRYGRFGPPPGAPEAVGVALIVLAYMFVMGIFCVLLAPVRILAGNGVSKRRQWGRWLTIILGILSLIRGILLLPTLVFPMADFTYGYLVLRVLLSKQYAREFSWLGARSGGSEGGI